MSLAISIRAVPAADLERLSEIDRSEHVTMAYRSQGHDLIPRSVDWNIGRWSVDGDGEQSLAHQRDFCRDHLAHGGIALGAFVPAPSGRDRLVGLGLVRPDVAPRVAQLAFLYVDRDHRRRGVSSALLDALEGRACDWGADTLYVSAIPSASAVGFYRRSGFEPVEPIPALFAREPDDIHMAKPLR